MPKTLRVLHVEDSTQDAVLIARHLSRADYELIHQRVETTAELRAALETKQWDVILCDYWMPHLNALEALDLLKGQELDIPFIIISGRVGEAVAVEAMRAGAQDYLMKDNLVRLVPTIERELQEAESRRARRRAEAEKEELIAQIKSQRERLNNIVASVPGVVWEAWGEPDAATQRINFISDYVETMLGYSVEEWLSTPNFWLSIVHPDDRARAASTASTDFASGKGSSRLEFRWVAKDGRVLWVEANSALARDEAGKPAGLRGVNIDITKRKLAEEKLRQSEERYRLLFERNPQPMWVFDLETLAFLEVNDAAIQQYGYSHAEFLTMTIKDIRPPEEIPNLLDSLSGVTTQYEKAGIWKHQKKDGSIMEVEITAHELVFYGRQAQIVLAFDVTERRTLEGELRQSQKMEAVGRLAGGIAHDFNNLLTVINGYCELTLRRLKPDDALTLHLEEIKAAGIRAATLTRQLLAFSRKQVLQPKVLDLNAVISELERMLQRLIGEDINLRTVLRPDLRAVHADPGQIEQVIMNLVVNARDAMPDGGKLTVETQNVYLTDEYARQHIGVKPGPYVMLAVSDNGSGMDDEIKARIFEPFFTTKGPGKGTGLGLSTVYGIVKQSMGNIWSYSEKGMGTTFKIYLPAIDEDVDSTHPSQTNQQLASGSETILLVEDDEMVRGLTRTTLEVSGYKVLQAANGVEALRVCEQHPDPIHLLLTDVVMPGMSGRIVADRLTTLRPQMLVLYMSGYTENAIVHHGVLNEGVNFIGKPFSPSVLARRVRELLDA